MIRPKTFLDLSLSLLFYVFLNDSQISLYITLLSFYIWTFILLGHSLSLSSLLVIVVVQKNTFYFSSTASLVLAVGMQVFSGYLRGERARAKWAGGWRVTESKGRIWLEWRKRVDLILIYTHGWIVGRRWSLMMKAWSDDIQQLMILIKSRYWTRDDTKGA